MRNSKLPLCIATALLIAANGAFAAAPIVTNVVAQQRAGTKFVDIKYDVLDADGDLLKIRLEISHNAGTNYLVPTKSLTGDLGNNISSGTNKVIVWNAGIDWDGEYSPLMRVKIIASDNRGFPGMEWGQEVPPGGFLMGQDGGVEGIGPAKHVNIPYSYWLSKYEVTVAQYAVFLTTALALGDVYKEDSLLKANGGAFQGVPAGTIIYFLNNDIKWNLNKLVVSPGVQTNFPVLVPLSGAMAFSQYYGYDLPTEAEWEKAARGAAFDGLGEHRLYPWGNESGTQYANYSPSGMYVSRTPVGYYNGNQIPLGPDMANGYGLYDLIGNAAEWTRTTLVAAESYPATESTTNSINTLALAPKVTRGGHFARPILPIYTRWPSEIWAHDVTGLRLVRRATQ